VTPLHLPGPQRPLHCPSISSDFLAWDAILVLILSSIMLTLYRYLRDRLFLFWFGIRRVTVTTISARMTSGQAHQSRRSRMSKCNCVMCTMCGCACGSPPSGSFSSSDCAYALIWGLFAARVTLVRSPPIAVRRWGLMSPDFPQVLAVLSGGVKPLTGGGLFVLLEIATNSAVVRHCSNTRRGMCVDRTVAIPG